MEKVGVVILNWNGADMMRKYLPSVVSCSKVTKGAQVYVADNGSDDDSVLMLEESFPDVKIIRFDKNYGFAEGYNKALQKVDAQYYVLLNSDVEIRDEGWLDPLVEYMDKNPDVGACQPKLLSLRNDKEFEYAGAAGGFIDKYGYPFCRGRIFDVVETDHGQYDEIVPLFWATGAALMTRREDYWSAGGLDPRFFAHMEEIDFCWRLRSMDRKIVCIPESKAYHLGGATLERENPRKTFLNFRNNRLMLYKNLPEKGLASTMRIRFLLDVMAAFSFLMKGHTGDFKAVFKALREFHKIKEDFEESRDVNKERAVLTDIPERKNYSLLWQFHVKGRKKFSELVD